MTCSVTCVRSSCFALAVAAAHRGTLCPGGEAKGKGSRCQFSSGHVEANQAELPHFDCISKVPLPLQPNPNHSMPGVLPNHSMPGVLPNHSMPGEIPSHGTQYASRAAAHKRPSPLQPPGVLCGYVLIRVTSASRAQGQGSLRVPHGLRAAPQPASARSGPAAATRSLLGGDACARQAVTGPVNEDAYRSVLPVLVPLRACKGPLTISGHEKLCWSLSPIMDPSRASLLPPSFSPPPLLPCSPCTLPPRFLVPPRPPSSSLGPLITLHSTEKKTVTTQAGHVAVTRT